MNQALKHRGPEAEGVFFDGRCGLGHRRLKILDLSDQANQPMYSRDGRYVMVFNGEVYNYRDLSKHLEFPPKTSSDTEVILELFAQQGPRFLYHLNGMFALAIYDQVEKRLFITRDRMGIKPLYYYWDEENLAFASELKALICLDKITPELQPEAISDFLHLGYIPAPRSIYKNIYKLKPGTYLSLQNKDLNIQEYWNLEEKVYDSATQQKLALFNREDEAKKHLVKTLESAVEHRLISDVPLGVFLSGGIDSSLVSALASKQQSQKLQTFSIRFSEADFNEADYARKVAEHLGTQHEEFTVSTREAQELIPQLSEIYDEPFADSSAIPTYLVSKLARQSVTVALGGDGGDELFFGYGMYQWADRLSKNTWKNFRKPVSKALSLGKANRYQKASRLFDYANSAELPSHIFSQEQHLFSRKEIELLLENPALSRAYQSPTFKRPLSAMESQAFYDLNYYLPDDLLVKVDRASMQHALELRVPLLDHRVVEFALNLHPSLKYRKGESKYLLKQVLYDHLPESLFDRPKRGFAVPLIQWLQNDLSYLLDEFLSEEILKKYGLFKIEPIQEMIQKFRKGNSFFYHRLWTLIVLHQFLSRNFPNGL